MKIDVEVSLIEVVVDLVSLLVLFEVRSHGVKIVDQKEAAPWYERIWSYHTLSSVLEASARLVLIPIDGPSYGRLISSQLA